MKTFKHLSLKGLLNWNSLQRATASGRFIPFVDGLRFLAILPVVLVHSSERLFKYNPEVKAEGTWEEQLEFLISRGAIGVFIFFALSGFILSLPYASGKRPVAYRQYLGKRLTRLEPPYIFWMLLFALIFMWQSGTSVGFILPHLLASLTYTHTLIYGEFSVINPVAWSLEVEIQYYLLAPFLAVGYFKLNSKRLRRSLLIIGVILFLLVQHVLSWHLFPLKATLLGHFHEFLIGMLMADLYKNETGWLQRKSIIWDFMAPVSLLVMAYTWTEELGKTFLMSLALATLFMAALKGKYFPALLSLKPLTLIGGMCYTIYLIHLPLLELLYSFIAKIGQPASYSGQLSISLLIALPVVLLSSMIAYRTIEQPFMNRKLSWPRWKRSILKQAKL